RYSLCFLPFALSRGPGGCIRGTCHPFSAELRSRILCGELGIPLPPQQLYAGDKVYRTIGAPVSSSAKPTTNCISLLRAAYFRHGSTLLRYSRLVCHCLAALAAMTRY